MSIVRENAGSINSKQSISDHLMQYLGMGLLFLHTNKRTDLKLDWKLKIPMIIFAPFSQMGFLASYIFYWNKGDPQQEVG